MEKIKTSGVNGLRNTSRTLGPPMFLGLLGDQIPVRAACAIFLAEVYS